MPDLTITVTQAQAARIRQAFRNRETGALPSLADMEAIVKSYLREKVVHYELKDAADDAMNIMVDELKQEGWEVGDKV